MVKKVALPSKHANIDIGLDMISHLIYFYVARLGDLQTKRYVCTQ